MKTHLTDLEGARALGFATFNPGPHLCVDVAEPMATVTLNFPGGKQMTVCYVHDAECVDVQVHQGREVDWNGDKSVVQPLVAFNGGGILWDYRSLENETDARKLPLLTTYLLGDR